MGASEGPGASSEERRRETPFDEAPAIVTQNSLSVVVLQGVGERVGETML